MSTPNDRAEPSEADENADRAALLKRRAVLIGAAIGGVVLASGCAEPIPCLSPPPDLRPKAPDSPSAVPLTEDGMFSITKAEALALGLPAIGFRATMKRGGFTITGPSRDQYVAAHGPPGGTVAFLAKPYHDGFRDQASIDVLFRRALADRTDLDPIEAGAEDLVALGGKQLEGRAFRTGRGPATTCWCVVRAPSAANPRAGVLLLFGVGTSEQSQPSCKTSLENAALAEIVKTLVFEE